MVDVKSLLFCSTNQHKIAEIKAILPQSFHLMGLSDIQWTEDIPEPFETFTENAAAKCQMVFQQTQIPCFSEDSGLCIRSLQERPGVYSARYAGPDKNAGNNIHKVLDELGETEDRAAWFISTIAFKPNADEIFFFEGKVHGQISHTPSGNDGFGYDPIFIPNGFSNTFAMLSSQIKWRVSHRTKAFEKFLAFLSDTQY